MVFHLEVLVLLNAKLSANHVLLRLHEGLKIRKGFFRFIAMPKKIRLQAYTKRT